MKNKEERLLTLFYSLLRGEGVQTQTIADKNHITTRTASRDLETLRCILANDRDFFGNMDLYYDRSKKRYYLSDEEMLKVEELFVIIEILVGSRGLEKSELLSIIHKLKKQVLFHDRKLLSSLIQNKNVGRKSETTRYSSGNSFFRILFLCNRARQHFRFNEILPD